MDDYRLSAIERALILAASGRFDRVNDLRRALRAEGYMEEGQLRGASIAKQIQTLIQAAKSRKAPSSSSQTKSPTPLFWKTMPGCNTINQEASAGPSVLRRGAF
jgi:hypothetical protein